MDAQGLWTSSVHSTHGSRILTSTARFYIPKQQAPGGYFNETTQVLALAVQNANISDFCIAKSTVLHMHAMKEYRRSGGIVLFIINLGTRRACVVILTPYCFTPG
jgi:hypothetical protein